MLTLPGSSSRMTKLVMIKDFQIDVENVLSTKKPCVKHLQVSYFITT